MTIQELIAQANELKMNNYELSEEQKRMVIFVSPYQLPINLRRVNANDH